jgi:dUTPase
MMFVLVYKPFFDEVEEFDDLTKRGESGFGSTGK